MTSPILYIIAGANGSGKTTFALHFTSKLNLPFINADEIAKSINPNNLEKARIQAGRLFFEKLKINLQQGHSFAIESTLAGHYLVKIIAQAKALNYQIHITYLYLNDPAINIDRVKARVLAGGHNVPDLDVIRRFYRSKNLFWNSYRELSDQWILVYNSDDSFEEVAYGVSTEHTVLDQLLFDQFIKGLTHDVR